MAREEMKMASENENEKIQKPLVGLVKTILLLTGIVTRGPCERDKPHDRFYCENYMMLAMKKLGKPTATLKWRPSP